ncbi:u3 snornp protein utp20 [Moniliophthora roreri MCA 2997]|uniref:U3 snornp protein utp20 n=1 Tax=Moniliophthora roreri (strain MCA 2997) TaxID=1381753 RepID=V2XZ39_MONRO|nr:u3 snornp protein utp20 [Moniliophthora roreri MCA 2997]
MMDFDEHEKSLGAQPVVEKRFKYKSYNQELKDVHLPSALSGKSKLDQELEDTQSHFYEALIHWQQLNLSPSYVKFAQKAGPISASLPLLLHNWKVIVGLWVEALDSSDDEGLKALLDLLQKLAQDLRSTLEPVYIDLLSRLLRLLTRTMLPESLTTLLSTLSTLFKYLFIPSTEPSLLEQTWSAIRQTISKCLPEIQRAIAEVWGNVLRKLKAALKERGAVIIAEDLDGIEDAAAWCFVSACKSVSQTLHTVTPSLIRPLVTHYLSCQSEKWEKVFTLLRRVLTAFIHHVKGAEQFSAIADIIFKEFSSSSSTDEERLGRLLELAAVPTSVRNGSRLLAGHLAQLYTEVTKIPLPLPFPLHAAFLRLTSSLLTAGDMSAWMSSGRALTRLWDNDEMIEFTLQLHGILADLSWGGWKMIALPVLVRKTPKFMEGKGREVIRLLASISRSGKISLADVDLVWKHKMEEWSEGRLKDVIGKNCAELDDILSLSTHFGFKSKIPSLLVSMVDAILSVPPSGKDAFPHSAWVLNVCMVEISKIPAAQVGIDLSSWTMSCTRNWAWSKHVLKGLVGLINARGLKSTDVTFEDAYSSTKQSLLSHSADLRLSVLQLLVSCSTSTLENTKQVVQRCLQGEEVPLDVQGVRERVLRIGKVAQVVKDGDEVGAEVAARWLIAQLKVNLRPIWTPAAKALAEHAEHFGDVTWDLLFQEIKEVSQSHSVEYENDELVEEEEQVKDIWEEERSWRDPSAHKLRVAVLEWLDAKSGVTRMIKESRSKDRFDRRSYELQLLSTLGECSSLTEKHNRDIIPFFLSPNNNASNTESTLPLPRTKLLAWLTVFAKFHNPKALVHTDLLRELYTSLLSHPDRSLQSAALECVLTYKQRAVVFYQEKLRSLLDDTRRRDELTMLNISSIEPQDRMEVVDTIIRLLFGIMLEKKDKGRSRRAAVLAALAGSTEEELGLLVALMVQPIKGERADNESLYEIQKVDASDKQLTGFLTLLGDVMKNLGSRLVVYWPTLLGATIDIVAYAQAGVSAAMEVDRDDAVGDADEEGEEETASNTKGKALRSIRQLGLKRLGDFFRSPAAPSFNFIPYVQASFPAFISPRVPNLNKENTQAPSALLDLFHVWTINKDHVFFLIDYDDQVLPQILNCLAAANVKPSVISRVLDIVEKVVALADSEDVLERVLKPHVSLLLTNLSILLERSKGKGGSISFISTPLGQRLIATLAQLAHYLSNGTEASTLVVLFTPWLRKSSKVVSEKLKVDLLKIISQLMRLILELKDPDSEMSSKVYQLLSFLFQSLRGRPARLALVSAFKELAAIQVGLQPIADLMESLNSYSTKRLDEPDFERRLEGFARLNDSLYKTLTPREWLPILYNMLFCIHDPSELAIRNNASFSMRHFIDLVQTESSSAEGYETEFTRVLFPGLKNGLRSKNELVRAEILSVISYAIAQCQRIASLQDMRYLLAGGDEEANFFNNILHVQIHRRSRALRRLADTCDEHPMKSATLSDIFIPLIGNYIVSTSSLDHHLVNEAIQTTGRLAKHLGWSAYYGLIQRYLKMSKAKDEMEKVCVRALVAILENFHFVMEEEVAEDPEKPLEDDSQDDEVDAVEKEISSKNQQAQSQRIVDAVNVKLLPTLLKYLESRDATTEDTTRIPIAVGVVKVAKHLPQASAQLQITRLLTTTAQIMRSKSQDTRDLTRDTLCRIAVVLGPSYLPLMFRELRGALLRGPHLHILATTIHHIIVHVTTGDNEEQFTTLDDCVADVAHVSAEVVFGESGKEVQAEGFKTKLREVKSSTSKGLDSFSIVAKHITPKAISGLLLPLRSIMAETETTKTMGLVDEVLKYIANGLNSNKHLDPKELLGLCHTLITQNSKFLQEAPTQNPKKKGKKGKEDKNKAADVIVQTKRQVQVNTDHYANNSYRFVVFGLDLLQTALRRSRFDFHDADTLARLNSMVVAVGNTLYSSNSPVLTSSLRVVSGLVKCPLSSLERSLPVFIRQTLEIIKRLGNIESDLAQTALKTLAVCLRDGSSKVDVKEKDLTFLLEIIAPDLEEPSRQNAVFQMLRAIISRKFVVPEIYDLMEKVSEIMVTSQSASVQELGRSALLQFLLDYPQGKGRLRNQMTFLAKNLSYVHESGRKSVLELLGAIVAKFQENLILEYSDLLFLSLVMVVANDDSAKCREMAAQLIKSLVEKFDKEKRDAVFSHLHVWSSQEAQPQLVRVSSQVYGIVIDALGKEISSYLSSILEDACTSLERSSKQLSSLELEDEAAMEVDLDWQPPYYSLIVLGKLARIFPEVTTPSDDSVLDWKVVIDHLLFPHTWVRSASCRLLGTLYSTSSVERPVSVSRSDEELFTPSSLGGMKETANKLCLQLKSEHLDDALGVQIVKNLFFIGKCFAMIPLANVGNESAQLDDEDDDDDVSDKETSPLPWLFSKLSYQVRSSLIARRNKPSNNGHWYNQPLSIVRWFAAMASHLDPSILERFLVHILSPVYRLIEEDTINDPKLAELKDVAIELQELVQTRVGPTRFSIVYNQIRQGVLSVRKERKEARVLQMAINPQAAANRKAHRNAVKKDSRKRKNQSFVEGKGKPKRRREE